MTVNIGGGGVIPGLRCPVCQEEVPMQTSLRNPLVKMRPGDFSLCYYCASPLRCAQGTFGDLALRLITEEEAPVFARAGGRAIQDVLRAMISGRERQQEGG